MSCRIEGIGTAVPRHRIGQVEALELARSLCNNDGSRRDALAAVYRRSGVRYRHSVLFRERPDGSVCQDFYHPAADPLDLGPTTGHRMQRYETEAGPLALEASKRAIDDAGIGVDRLTHLITVSCTGFVAPSFDFHLVRALGLNPSVARTHIGFMGCHAAMNAVRAAAGYTQANPDACVLVCAVELCTLHHQYGWDPDHVVANALFADGAAALVVSGDITGPQAARGVRVLGNGSAALSQSSDLMAWRIGDHGFEMRLSPKVPEVIRQCLRPWLGDWLESLGVSADQVGSWAIHPGGPRVLAACAQALGLASEAIAPSRHVLAEYGNMSSPTVLFILDSLRRQDAPLPWVALGFGPGLAVEGMLVGRPADEATRAGLTG